MINHLFKSKINKNQYRQKHHNRIAKIMEIEWMLLEIVIKETQILLL